MTPYLVVLLAGALVAIQTSFFSLIHKGLKHPLLSLSAIFFIAAIFVLIGFCLQPSALPDKQTLVHIPWYAWLGGILGVAYVTCVMTLAPKMGIAMITVTSVLGQLIASMLIDHFGLFGTAAQPISIGKLLGIAVMTTGVALMKFF